MPYSTAFLRLLRLPLSVLGQRRNSQSDLNTPLLGLSDLSLYNLVMDITESSKNEESFIATSTQTVFTIASAPYAKAGNNIPVEVFRNGLKLRWVASAPAAGQFTYSGTTITVSSSTVSDVIIVKY